MHRLLSILFILNSILSFSQSIKNTKKWSGHLDLGINLTNNVEQTLQINNLINLNYKTKKYNAIFNNSLSYISNTGEEDLLNKGSKDFKYELLSKDFNFGFTLEHLYDISRKIKNRYTTGVGMSYNLLKKEDIILSLIAQREKEQILYGDLKFQNRLNLNIILKKKVNNIELNIKNSYQPNLEGFGDFRTISAISVRINLSAKFILACNANINYDSSPEPTIPERDYQITNSLSYSF